MFFKKVLHDTELIYDFKNYKGIVIGESAGTELQLKRYFITSKNNYYGYFAFYDGFGLINRIIKECSNKTKSTIYAIFDDGALIYNKKTNNIEQFGNIKIIEPNND